MGLDPRAAFDDIYPSHFRGEERDLKMTKCKSPEYSLWHSFKQHKEQMDNVFGKYPLI